MQENTNKSIAVNSLILYIRLAIISISGLLYTRFSLQALGISDYGLYSVIACIITFISIINTIMVTTSNRFIAIAIGKNDGEEVCRQFNVNLVIHVIIALLTVAIALPAGHWYIMHHVSYDGDMQTVLRVFDALNDPLMGNIIERTRTRWGKYKPWLVIGILSTSAVVYLAFMLLLGMRKEIMSNQK